MKYLMLLALLSCGTYTDPEGERVIYYKCKGSRELVLKHSQDYESIVLRFKNPPIVLHRYVTELDDGYRSESYIWRGSENNSELIEIDENGSAHKIRENCRPQGDGTIN